MKKLILVVSLIVGLAFNAQAQSFKGKGSQDIYVGLSSASLFRGIGLQGNYDYGVHEFFSVGGQVGLSFNFPGFGLYVGPRADFHILNAVNLKSEIPIDLYLGATLGLGLFANDGGASVGFGWGGYLGVAWQFAERMALRGEIGSGASIGIVFDL